MISYIEDDLLITQNYQRYDYIITPMNIYNIFDGYWGSILTRIIPEIKPIVLESGRNLYGNKKQLGTVCFTSIVEPSGENIRPTNVITCCFLKGFNFRPDIETIDEFDYESLEICFDKIKVMFGGQNKKFCLPKYNKMRAFRRCNWDKISFLLEKYFSDEYVDVYCHNHQIMVNYLSIFRKGLKLGNVEYRDLY